MLAFIEFIAVFFLRQYREAMDQFRHYEGVKRYREEVLSLLIILKSKPDWIDADKLMDKKSIFFSQNTLEAGESTEVLETRKLAKDEMDAVIKLVATLKGETKK